MHEHQAQRTLVKSRPELWAEVSDVESLCKHLGEFGEIAITRLEPETTVAWEGTAARGTVELEASGWGTKVTLTAELTAPDAGEPDPVAVSAPEPEPAPEPVRALTPEPAPEPVQVARAEPVPTPAVPAAAPVAAPRPPTPGARPTPTAPTARASRPGFLARLFGRKSAPAPMPAPARTPAVSPPLATPAVEAPADPPPLRIVPEPEPERVVPIRRPEPDPDEAPQGDPDPPLVATGPPRPRALDGERAVAVLTAALDDLGAAHRRPFSRS